MQISWDRRGQDQGNYSRGIFIAEIQQIGTGALLIVNNYILGLIWGTDSIYLFDWHSKDENGKLSSSGRVLLEQFQSSSFII